MTDIAIIHNHPIHYKHLLFTELARQNLNFEVLFTGASSGIRIERPLPRNGEYRFQIGFDGPYEQAPTIHTVRSVWSALQRMKPRAVVIGGYYDVAAWTAWLWAGYAGAGRILWAESNSFDHPRHAWKEFPKRVFVTQCNIAHVYGISNKEYIQKLGMAADRVFTKRAVADTALFLNGETAVRAKPPYKVLLYVGRFSPEKNLSFLIRAFRGIQQNSHAPLMKLVLVGYGPMEEELKGLAEELGIAQLVEFPGRAQQKELPAIYRGADAFILPSTREPWGLVANEAMLCGLPVLLSTQCGCASDLVDPGSGWSFSPWDEQALTGLLQEIAGIPRQALEERGTKARAIAAKYSPENCATIVADTVRQLLEKGTATGPRG